MSAPSKSVVNKLDNPAHAKVSRRHGIDPTRRSRNQNLTEGRKEREERNLLSLLSLRSWCEKILRQCVGLFKAAYRGGDGALTSSFQKKSALHSQGARSSFSLFVKLNTESTAEEQQTAATY